MSRLVLAPAPLHARPVRRRATAGLLILSLVLVLAGVALFVWTRTRPEAAVAWATLRTSDGRAVGRVDFFDAHPGTRIRASVRFPAGAARSGAFHGFHIHANDDATNGNGCIANPANPARTWFTSADGHYDAAGHHHADHAGDLDGLYLMGDGSGAMEVRTDRVSAAALVRRVVIVHAGADNFGNVPVGSGPQDYTP